MQLDAQLRDASAWPQPLAPSVVTPREAGSAALLRWLDDGLRQARPGRLGEEYRAILADPSSEHVAIYLDDRPVSHALTRTCTVRAGGRALRIGMIGLVYTDPAHRGRGLAGRCISAALERNARRGAGVTILWSDQPDYYARLGFLPAGLERLVAFDARSCRVAARGRDAGLPTTEPGPGDWAALEALHAGKPVRIDREPGRLAELARVPECRVLVARDGRRPVAYAALGKGDDFRGVVHEWAGSAGGVLACLGALAEPIGEALLLAGPHAEPAIQALQGVGAPVLERPSGLVHVTDAATVWRDLTGSHPRLADVSLRGTPGGARLAAPHGDVALDARAVLDLLFGSKPYAASLDPLDGARRNALRERLPFPLFVWGFDSI